MLESYRCDHYLPSSQHMSLANGQSPFRPYLTYKGRTRASYRRAGLGMVSSAGLSQQGISPLNGSSSAPSTVLQSQQRHCSPPHGSQPSAQAKRRDVRAHIRAPAIPALESQPYREGADKTSHIQAGTTLALQHLGWGAMRALGHVLRSQPVPHGLALTGHVSQTVMQTATLCHF